MQAPRVVDARADTPIERMSHQNTIGAYADYCPHTTAAPEGLSQEPARLAGPRPTPWCPVRRQRQGAQRGCAKPLKSLVGRAGIESTTNGLKVQTTGSRASQRRRIAKAKKAGNDASDRSRPDHLRNSTCRSRRCSGRLRRSCRSSSAPPGSPGRQSRCYRSLPGSQGRT